MIDNSNSTKNLRQINGPSVEIIRDTDDILNIDTTLGPVTLTLQNISSAGISRTDRKVYINDIGGQIAVNPITVLPSGGDLVNSGVSVILNVNGANAVCSVANLSEWSVTGVGVISAGIGGGGTLNRIAKFITPSTIGDSLLFDNGVSVGIGTITPHASAIFDITSTTQGLLYPRMTTAQRNAIVTPATSLIIFNVTTSRFEYFNGAVWTSMDMNGIYGGAGTVPTSTVATVTDFLRFISVSGGVTTEYGIGADPLGFGYSGTVNYLFSTPSVNLEGWGGLMTVAGEPAWWHEVYNVAGDTSGFFAGYSVAQSNSYSSIYHFQIGTGLYTGFEANASGEQLYSQRLALVPTALTVNDRVLFASASGGYMKVTTYADLVTQLAIPTFYSSNGSTPGARTITLGGTLQFNHGVGGVNGYVQMATGGYFRNNSAGANNYFEFNHNTNIFTVNTTTATVSGYVASNNAAYLRADVSSGAYAGITISGATNELGFYVDGGLKYAGGIRGGSGAFNGSWGFGITPTTAAKVHIYSENGQGNGTVIQTGNLSPAESILQVRDAANFNVIDVRATGLTFIGSQLRVGYALGSIPSVGAFGVKGADSSFLTKNHSVYDGSNILRWQMQNNGSTSSGAGTAAPAPLSIFGNYWNAQGFSEAGWGFYGYDCGKNLSVQMGGTTPIGIAIATQGAPTGLVQGINSFIFSIAAATNTGVSGAARNGTSEAIGVHGLIGGGASILSAIGVKAVKGEAATNVDVHQWGAEFWAYESSGGIVYTAKDFVGVEGRALGATNVGSTVRTIGGRLRATSAAGSPTAYGAWLEATGPGANYALVTNGGNIGFGTVTPSNQALLELVSTTQGMILMRMTAAQASAIVPADGMWLYVTDTNLTFVVVGFWGYENGTWVKL